MTYEVILFTTEVTAQGVNTKINDPFVFEDENPLDARKAAVTKAKELELEYSKNPNFDSPLQAAAKDYKDYSSYSINIKFYPNQDPAYSSTLYGDGQEETKDALQNEVFHYDNKKIDFPSITIENEDGIRVDVISEDFEYLMSE